jgi:signal transduction histidine kinase
MVQLDACPLFAQLADDEQAMLRGAAQERSFAAKVEIFKEGDAGDGVYVVKEGQVEISGLVGENVRHNFSRIMPGDIFGEMAVLENKPRSACATAKEATTVYFIPRDDMLKLVASSPSLAMGLLREISHRLREFNRQYIEEVLQTERLTLVGRFARSIVHDLKNPLNIISLSAELTGSPRSTPDSRLAARERISRQVERISEMVNEILEFTQGSQNTYVPVSLEYDFFVNQVLEEVKPEVELKSAVIVVENQPPAVRLPLNPKRLRRVFHNLLHNATDAMPGGGKILVRFHRADHEVVTEIEDAGPGIAPEIAGRLFDAFATHGKEHGTGLGLSICKKIVEDHHGRIWARNAAGRGAIFSFALPAPA